MGLILDSSVLITAERKGETVDQLLKQIFALTGDQDTMLSAIALVELVHGIHRASTPQIRTRREAFIRELLADPGLSVHRTDRIPGRKNLRRSTK